MECLKTITELLTQVIDGICGPGTRITLNQLPDIPKLNESVYEFYSPKNGTSPNVEIVFFHGIQFGDYSKAYMETWTSVDGLTTHCWPQTWLAEAFPRARILSVSYDSSTSRGRRHGRLDLYCTAENLLQDLMNMEANVAKKGGCPLILIGQDLGGLIIKAVCMKAARDEGRRTFLSNLKGIMYYSTPHLGLLEWPAKFNGALAQNLGFGNTDITRLNHEFQHLRSENKWAAKALVAAYKGKQCHVGEAPARFDVDDFYMAMEDFDNLCKPKERTSVGFTHLTSFISNCLSIKLKFALLNFQDDRYYVPMRATEDKIRTSLIDARFVVLHGGPGSGKTSLAKYLALRFQEESRKQGGGLASTSQQFAVFPDGVVYLYCGNKANIVSKLRELLRKLGFEAFGQKLDHFKGDEAFGQELDHFNGDEAFGQELDHFKGDELRQILVEKLVERIKKLDNAALVVLDDVWDPHLLDSLLVHVGKVKYIVTTQISTLWSDCNSKTIQIQDVGLKAARQILGNYGNFKGGVIPKELEGVADDIIKATMSHPLSLATLAMVMARKGKTSKDKWLDLKVNLLQYLRSNTHQAVAFGERYRLSVEASMMFAVEFLEVDARKLLYLIALFEGPSIPEAFVQLILMYTQPKACFDYVICKDSLEARGMMWDEKEEVYAYAKLEDQDWRVLSIHELHHHFILNKMDDVVGITNFLDGDNKFLHLGKRSTFDLATTLCALYGVTVVKEKAMAKMGDHFIWSDDLECFSNMAYNFRIMVSLMFKFEGKKESHNSHVAKVATKVFWKFFMEGKLDDHHLSSLINTQECTKSTCIFLRDLCITVHDTRHELSMEAVPFAMNNLFRLLSNNVEETVQLVAMEAIVRLSYPSQDNVLIDILANTDLLERLVVFLCKDMDQRCEAAITTLRHFARAQANKPIIALYPSLLKGLVGLLAQDLDEKIQIEAMFTLTSLALSNDKQALVEILECANPELLQGLMILLSKEMGIRCKAAARMLRNLAFAIPNKEIIARHPYCVSKLVRLLERDVDKSIQEQAVQALQRLSTSPDFQVRIDMVRTDGLLKGLIILLSEDTEETCKDATKTIYHLAVANPNRVVIARFPYCLDRLVGLLAQDLVDKSIQMNVLDTLGLLASCDDMQVRIDMVVRIGLLKALVMLLSKDMEDMCRHAAMIICTLAESDPNRAIIARFPNCVDRLIDLLAQDVDESIQEPVVVALLFLAVSSETQVAIDMVARRGLLERLIMLLSKDMEGRCREATVVAIYNLALASPNRAIIAKFPNCLDKLHELLASDVDSRIQECASATLRLLACSNEAQVHIDMVAT